MLCVFGRFLVSFRLSCCCRSFHALAFRGLCMFLHRNPFRFSAFCVYVRRTRIGLSESTPSIICPIFSSGYFSTLIARCSAQNGPYLQYRYGRAGFCNPDLQRLGRRTDLRKCYVFRNRDEAKRGFESEVFWLSLCMLEQNSKCSKEVLC